MSNQYPYLAGIPVGPGYRQLMERIADRLRAARDTHQQGGYEIRGHQAPPEPPEGMPPIPLHMQSDQGFNEEESHQSITMRLLALKDRQLGDEMEAVAHALLAIATAIEKTQK